MAEQGKARNGILQKGSGMIVRLIKYFLILAVLVAAAIAGYAVFFDLPPPSQEIIISVTPNGT